MLSCVAIHYNLNKNDLHCILKVWYKIKTTSNLSYNEWYDYVDKVHYFMAWVFDMYFDPDYWKFQNTSFTWLYRTERPDNFYLLF